MTETANSAKSLNCQWCGIIHTTPGVCSWVKAFEYHPDGTLKRVEFNTGADYPQWTPTYMPPQFPWRGHEIT